MTSIDLVESLVIGFTAIFLMEIGDKTQITAFALSLRYRDPYRVFCGSIIGLTGVTIIAVIIGILMRDTIDVVILKPVIGIIFILGGIIIGVRQFRIKNSKSVNICPISLELCDKPRENCPEIEGCKIYLENVVQKGAFINSVTIMFLAELGDKTMLMGAGLATQFDPIGVFIGAIIALALVNGIGVIMGDKIAMKIPKDKINYLSMLLFVIIGLVILVSL
jgi:putative Ca2+/H+ antiporter (TMEM165/GDT1 family)